MRVAILLATATFTAMVRVQRRNTNPATTVRQATEGTRGGAKGAHRVRQTTAADKLAQSREGARGAIEIRTADSRKGGVGWIAEIGHWHSSS